MAEGVGDAGRQVLFVVVDSGLRAAGVDEPGEVAAPVVGVLGLTAQGIGAAARIAVAVEGGFDTPAVGGGGGDDVAALIVFVVGGAPQVVGDTGGAGALVVVEAQAPAVGLGVGAYHPARWDLPVVLGAVAGAVGFDIGHQQMVAPFVAAHRLCGVMLGQQVAGGAVIVAGQGLPGALGMGMPGDQGQAAGGIPLQAQGACGAVGEGDGAPGIEGVFGKVRVVKVDPVAIAVFDAGQGQVEEIVAAAPKALGAPVLESNDPKIGRGMGEGELLVGVEMRRAEADHRQIDPAPFGVVVAQCVGTEGEGDAPGAAPALAEPAFALQKDPLSLRNIEKEMMVGIAREQLSIQELIQIK